MDVVLLHGALGSQEQVDTLAEAFSAVGRIYSFSFSGHGGNPFSRSFSIPQFALELQEFIALNELDRPQIFGYSMGGYVALYLASQQPDVMGSIFTYGTKFNWTPETAKAETQKLNPEIIEEKVPHFAQMLETRHAPEDWKQLLLKTAEMMVGLGNHPTLTQDVFEKIPNQVLITRGTEDQMISREESEYAAALLPNGKFRSFEGMKHPVEKINPEEFLPVLNDFYNGAMNS